jgi:uncharacterized membrane protein
VLRAFNPAVIVDMGMACCGCAALLQAIPSNNSCSKQRASLDFIATPDARLLLAMLNLLKLAGLTLRHFPACYVAGTPAVACQRWLNKRCTWLQHVAMLVVVCNLACLPQSSKEQEAASTCSLMLADW